MKKNFENKANREIRQRMSEIKITQWQLASHLSVHENTVMKRLRTELAPEEKTVFMRAIDEIEFARNQKKGK